jgi:hypothetical protein
MAGRMASCAAVAALAALAIALGACGRPFDIRTAPGFIELADQEDAQYDFRATTPEGVVVGVKAIDLEGEGSQDIAFWQRAITLQLRDVGGYALTATYDVRSLDGAPGKQLRFGHDEDGKPFTYWVSLFVSGKRLIVVEAGGPTGQFDKYAPSVEWMEKSVKVR